jgi:hypothetical protein
MFDCECGCVCVCWPLWCVEIYLVIMSLADGACAGISPIGKLFHLLQRHAVFKYRSHILKIGSTPRVTVSPDVMAKEAKLLSQKYAESLLVRRLDNVIKVCNFFFFRFLFFVCVCRRGKFMFMCVGFLEKVTLFFSSFTVRRQTHLPIYINIRYQKTPIKVYPM